MIRRPPRSTLDRSSAASDVYKRQSLCSAFRHYEISIMFVAQVAQDMPTRIRALAYYACLLYTSPSPRDRTRSRMPSSA